MIRSIIQLLSRLFLLLCVGWSSVASLRAQVQHAVSDLVSGTYYRIRTANSRAEALANGYLADESGMVKAQAFSSTDADVQLWLVTAVTGKSGYYTIQNKLTKKYLQGPEDTESKIATSSTATEVYVPKNTKTGRKYETWYNIMTSADAAYSYNWRGDLYMRGYKPNDGETKDNLSGSEWRFEVTYADEDAYMAAEGHVLPVAGDKVYRIFNASSPFSDNAIYEYDNALGSITDDTNDAQYWQLVAQSNGTMAIQNLKTGHYVQSLNGMKNTQYKVGTKPYGFTISKNSNKIWTLGYDIIDAESSTKEKLGLNCTDKPNGAIYSWTMFDGSKDLNSCWHFKDAGLTEEEIATIKANRTAFAKEDWLTDMLSNAKVRIKSRRGTSETWNAGGAISTVDCSNRYVTDMTDAVSDGNGTCRMETLKTDDDAYRQIWVLQKNGEGYTFRNLYTGKYLNYKNTGDAQTFYIRYNPDNADEDYYVNIANDADFSGDGLHYQTTYHIVVKWSVNADDYRGCDWLFESADITDEQVRERFDALAGHLSQPVTDQYVVIRNAYHGTVMSEDNHLGTVSDRSGNNYYQYWKFVAVEGKTGYYQVQNAITGNYINFANYNSQCSVTSTATDGGFKVNKLTNNNRFSSIFNFAITGREGHGLHASNGRIIVWSAEAGASTWYIESANVTEDQITAAKKFYANRADEVAATDTYKAALGTFFSDAACTTLQPTYQTMSDDDLKAAMTTAGITSTNLQNMAVKVKNNSWAKWEKTFRVLTAEPYTNPDTWNGILKIGYVYTRLTNPTGIWSKSNDLIYVFVGADIPEGATVNLRQVMKTDNQGTSVQLSKGLNIIAAPADEAALYISYEVTTSDATDSKKWRDYPDIPIHIEGGVVDGYFDATRTGIDTDAAWKEMVADGLFVKPFAMMKGRNIIYQMNSTLTKQTVPEKMREIVDFWDWMVDVQHSLMAVNEYKDRWHSVLGFYSCTYNYMFASSYGTYYNESTLGEILSYDKMSAGGGSLWGPAHEVGHIHQGLINMIGCTEISNNLFSQAVVHLNGKTSTRLNGRKFRDVANNYAAGYSWLDYGRKNGNEIWDCNTLYLKLYLYYEVQKHHPGFFCELFRKLRKDPLNHSKGSQDNPTPASGDYLKFAVKCAEVAQEDLSEFFEAFGFFRPYDLKYVDDYGNYYVTCTQEMADDAKAKIKACGKPNGNILFVENHIKHEPQQDHDGNLLYDAQGNVLLRTDYDKEDAVGKCGDVGSYSEYVAGNYANGYTYTRSGNTITMTGEGAVGYKVYDKDGNLLYFANTNSFVLPQTVADKLSETGQKMVIKVAQADGTDVTLPAADATKYTLKVYRADALTADKCATVYTDGTEATLPTIKNNELVYIASTDATVPTTLTEQTNYVNAADNTAYKLVLTDKQDFYAPSAFTAQTVTYSRANTAGYNSVCLPFAISAADFGSEARLEQFTSTDGQSVSLTSTTDENAAGQPCFVYCPETQTEWTLTKQNAHIVAEPIEASDGNAVLHGSFTKADIGAGQYKLTADGTAFGVTTNKGKVTAFRTYLTPATTAGAAALLQVLHDGAEVTGVNTAVQPAGVNQPAAVYDLTGRRVQRITRPGIYIVNGKKTVVRM